MHFEAAQIDENNAAREALATKKNKKNKQTKKKNNKNKTNNKHKKPAKKTNKKNQQTKKKATIQVSTFAARISGREVFSAAARRRSAARGECRRILRVLWLVM